MTSPKSVFRVQDKDNRGLYRSNMSWDLHELQSRHPAPHDDSALRDIWAVVGGRESDWFFGFKDLDQYRNWLYKDEHRLAVKAEGFYIQEYIISNPEHVQHGDTQAIFKYRGDDRTWELGRKINPVTFEDME